MRSHKIEFPDFVLDVTPPKGFVDHSDRSARVPCFRKVYHTEPLADLKAIAGVGGAPFAEVLLWIDYASPADSRRYNPEERPRSWGEAKLRQRFGLEIGHVDPFMPRWVMSTNNWGDILSELVKAELRMAHLARSFASAVQP
jgi:hypothetical protein